MGLLDSKALNKYIRATLLLSVSRIAKLWRMRLIDYTKQNGGQTALARLLGVSTVVVHHWAHGIRPIPAERCPAIERVTNGAVRCEDLRPDVDWAYLRATDCDKHCQHKEAA
jgi:DNA-binding transcriptional regulator YdaS (Cro superfamily)